MRFSASSLSFALLLGACRPGPAGAQSAPQAAAAEDPSLPPAGFGSLRQDAIGVVLGTDQVRIRVIPLDEHVIRMLSPDSYRSLRDMAASRAADIQRTARDRGLGSATTVMRTFFPFEPGARFGPDDLG